VVLKAIEDGAPRSMTEASNSSTASTLSYAQAAADALALAMAANPRIVALGEDLGRGGVFGQYRGLAQRFGPGRIIDTPISEAAIMGVAVGMALVGQRPVVELRIADFALCAMDEIVNQAAKNRYMFGGQGRVPVVIRMPIGIWSASAAQHSQSFEAWYAHVPGQAVVCPATPADNHGLLLSALDGDDPVAYLEHKELWSLQGPVQPGERVPFGKARIARPGRDLTLVSWSRTVHASLAAAQLLADEHGIDAEVIDLRSLWPWDRDAVIASTKRTGALLVAHEAVQAAGFGAEVAASVAEATGLPVARAGAPRLPVGYASVLEAQAQVTPTLIALRAQDLLRRPSAERKIA
jgi:pyruvate dehydrogenase E1 component beta subunit